jgi:hypothetical protein
MVLLAEILDLGRGKGVQVHKRRIACRIIKPPSIIGGRSS